MLVGNKPSPLEGFLVGAEMNQTVQEILQRKKLPKEFPPSKLDVETREKHVPESVDYNIKHFRDHGENVCDQLKKLAMVNPAKARLYARKACRAVQQVYKDLEKHTEG